MMEYIKKTKLSANQKAVKTFSNIRKSNCKFNKTNLLITNDNSDNWKNNAHIIYILLLQFVHKEMNLIRIQDLSKLINLIGYYKKALDRSNISELLDLLEHIQLLLCQITYSELSE